MESLWHSFCRSHILTCRPPAASGHGKLSVQCFSLSPYRVSADKADKENAPPEVQLYMYIDGGGRLWRAQARGGIRW